MMPASKAGVPRTSLRLIENACNVNLDSAGDEREFGSLRSLNFEGLKGARQHQHSMRLNDQWRLILEFKRQGPERVVMIVDIEDYH